MTNRSYSDLSKLYMWLYKRWKNLPLTNKDKWTYNNLVNVHNKIKELEKSIGTLTKPTGNYKP